uniref:Exonuclease domain-containing protein n=1 Tax=viral metagenome TaxID=1070528 RepID=A0A6C0EUH0_9ZZZZ
MFPTNYHSYRKVLVFDVETTGLIPKVNPVTKLPPPIEQYPHIIQLSYVKYNMYDHVIEEGYNAYINIPITVEITPKITELTGIRPEMCHSGSGQNIVDVLGKFYEAYQDCDCLVAHNVAFDTKMIDIELQRNNDVLLKQNPNVLNIFKTEFDRFTMEKFCTMMSSIHSCGILVTNIDKNGKTYTYKKFPKLSETYEHLFSKTPKDLHNSMMDTLVCLRCYLKMRHGVEIDNSRFVYWVEKYMKM